MKQLGFRDLAALYRAVLRANRQSLPPPLRALGDGYAADEFRRHLRAKTTPAQWLVFADAWRDYHLRLSAAPGGGGGGGSGSGSAAASEVATPSISGDLPAEVVAAMSREQRQQLEQLRRAAEALARGDGGGDGDGGTGTGKGGPLQ
jgi:hypothetical protein